MDDFRRRMGGLEQEQPADTHTHTHTNSNKRKQKIVNWIKLLSFIWRFHVRAVSISRIMNARIADESRGYIGSFSSSHCLFITMNIGSFETVFNAYFMSICHLHTREYAHNPFVHSHQFQGPAHNLLRRQKYVIHLPARNKRLFENWYFVQLASIFLPSFFSHENCVRDLHSFIFCLVFWLRLHNSSLSSACATTIWNVPPRAESNRRKKEILWESFNAKTSYYECQNGYLFSGSRIKFSGKSLSLVHCNTTNIICSKRIFPAFFASSSSFLISFYYIWKRTNRPVCDG